MRLVAPPALGDSMPPPVCAAAARDGEGDWCDCSKAELDGGFDGGRKPMECSMAGPLEASIRVSSMAKRPAACAACAAIIILAPQVARPQGREFTPWVGAGIGAAKEGEECADPKHVGAVYTDKEVRKLVIRTTMCRRHAPIF